MFTKPDFKIYDYTIGGKMVVGRASMEHSYAVQMNTDFDFRDEVKKKLIMDMAQCILENNLVEFTQYDDPLTGTKNIAVRAYLAPNDQVKILRLANKIV
jgi:hypothetical protein